MQGVRALELVGSRASFSEKTGDGVAIVALVVAVAMETVAVVMGSGSGGGGGGGSGGGGGGGGGGGFVCKLLCHIRALDHDISPSLHFTWPGSYCYHTRSTRSKNEKANR